MQDNDCKTEYHNGAELSVCFSLYIVITFTVTAVTATASFLPDLQNTTQNRQTMDNKMKVKQQ